MICQDNRDVMNLIIYILNQITTTICVFDIDMKFYNYKLIVQTSNITSILYYNG